MLIKPWEKNISRIVGCIWVEEKKFTFVKDKLNVITTNLNSIESYECFGLEETYFQGIGIMAMFF